MAPQTALPPSNSSARNKPSEPPANILRTLPGPLGDDLRALEEQLEDANRTRLDARQEHNCIPYRRTKTQLNKAGHCCAVPRRWRLKLLQGFDLRAHDWNGAPPPTSALSPLLAHQSRQADAGATSNHTTPPTAPLGSNATQQQHTPRSSQQQQQPSTAQETSGLTSRFGLRQAAELVTQLRELVRLASDPVAALHARPLTSRSAP